MHRLCFFSILLWLVVSRLFVFYYIGQHENTNRSLVTRGERGRENQATNIARESGQTTIQVRILLILFCFFFILASSLNACRFIARERKNMKKFSNKKIEKELGRERDREREREMRIEKRKKRRAVNWHLDQKRENEKNVRTLRVGFLFFLIR